jgi:hypothetical protein
LPGAADARPAVEDGPSRGEEDRRRRQRQEGREDEQDRARDQDVETAQNRVYRARLPVARQVDEVLQPGPGLVGLC